MNKSIGTDVNQIQITSLSHIRGQKKVTDLLQVNLDAYFQSRQTGNPSSFGPVLLTGNSGGGKSMVAKALHENLANFEIIETNGEMLANSSELFSILLSATKNSTLFIDECHGMGRGSANLLLTALSEKVLYVPQKGNTKSKRTIPLEPFVLILATTEEYAILPTLRNRMRICCRLAPYRLEDLVEIIRQRAIALNWDIESEQVLVEIGKRCKKTPRIALNRILQQCWNICFSQDRTVITLKDTYQAFELLQIDELGLDELERKYLRILQENGSTPLNVIASKLCLPSQTIKNVLEPYLLQENLIEKNKCSHREITSVGLEHIMNCKL